jgi:hypothetical protein
MTYSSEYRRILTKLGYYNYQSGLIYRQLNQDGGWDSHTDRCRAFIMKIIDVYRPEKITVLGSGWLIELPVAELIERTDNLALVDIVHPPEVLKQAGVYKNVTLIEDDVTGGLITEVWEKAGGIFPFRKKISIGEIIIPDYEPDFDPGLVISLNLITQLESLPVDFLKKRIRATDDEFLSFRKEIQERHLRFLKRHNSILVSDYEEVFTDRAGNTKVVPTLLVNLPDCEFSEEWDWNFDLQGADNYNSKSIMRVVAKSFGNYGNR